MTAGTTTGATTMGATRTTPLDAWVAARTGGPVGPDRERLRAHQLDALRRTVDLARSRSPFHRDRLADAPGLRTLEDLRRLPFTTAADLVAHGLRMVCVGQDDIHRVVTLETSGTTGAPKRVWFTREDTELTVDFFAAGMSTFTRPGDTVLVLLPCERPGGVGDLLATAVERLGARALRHSVVTDVPVAVEAVRAAGGADVAVGVPAQVLALARSGADLGLRDVLLSTDHLSRAVRDAIEAAWPCRVFDHWGMTETGLGGGVECEARRGYHLREADLLVEVVDPVTGDVVPDGVEGEVVVTTLTRTGMPFVRYRTGDLSRFLPGPCPCGTYLLTLAPVTRRVAGVVRLGPAGDLSRADLDEALLALPGVVDFDATLRRGPTGDRLEVAVRTAGWPGARAGTDAAAVTAAVQRLPVLHAAVRSSGLRLDVRVARTTDAPLPSKRRLEVVGADA